MRYWCNTLLTGIACSHPMMDVDPQCEGCKSASVFMSRMGQKWAKAMSGRQSGHHGPLTNLDNHNDTNTKR